MQKADGREAEKPGHGQCAGDFEADGSVLRKGESSGIRGGWSRSCATATGTTRRVWPSGSPPAIRNGNHGRRSRRRRRDEAMRGSDPMARTKSGMRRPVIRCPRRGTLPGQ
jgi:hypothetical protein